jgi:hypothetical protein
MTQRDQSLPGPGHSVALLAVAAATLAASASGCATLFSGTSQSLHVSSEPSGARVLVNGSLAGNTPTTITMKKGEPVTIVGQYPGLPDATVVVGKQMDTLAVLNLFDLFGWLIDMSTGAMWKFDRDRVVLQFQTAGWGFPPSPYGAPAPGHPPPAQYPPLDYPPQAYAPANTPPRSPHVAPGN